MIAAQVTAYTLATLLGVGLWWGIVGVGRDIAAGLTAGRGAPAERGGGRTDSRTRSQPSAWWLLAAAGWIAAAAAVEVVS